jgi:hypothetical protein
VYWGFPPEALGDFGAYKFPARRRERVEAWEHEHWFHTDQGRDKRGLQCVQGAVNIFETGAVALGMTWCCVCVRTDSVAVLRCLLRTLMIVLCWCLRMGS